MSRAFPDDPFLTGGYAPWPMEGDAHDLPVEGEIPTELDGTLFRNGPNPQFAPRGRYHWFDGDGMIHALTLRDGTAHYKNRWVRTPKFELEREAGEALMGGLANLTDQDPRAEGVPFNTANTNIVVHAGKLLALSEAGLPYELDPSTLATIGPVDFSGALESAFTAHPKLDPETGELLAFGYGAFPPYLRYYVVSAEGKLVRNEEIEVPVPTMMHDFVVTRDHVIFLVCPATFRAEAIETGQPIRWEPELGTQLGVMPRDGGSDDVRWFQTEACYVFHPLNGYSEEGKIVADVCRYPRVPLFDAQLDSDGLEGSSPAKLTRWTLDLRGGSLKEEELDDLPSEFPRLDERFAGLRHRHGYLGARAGEPGGPFDSVMHVDLETGRRRLHRLAEQSFASESIFVPRREGSPEGEGFLLTVVYRALEDRSDLVILDAENVEGAPLATVRLPHRVPFGFHGNWGQGL